MQQWHRVVMLIIESFFQRQVGEIGFVEFFNTSVF